MTRFTGKSGRQPSGIWPNRTAETADLTKGDHMNTSKTVKRALAIGAGLSLSAGIVLPALAAGGVQSQALSSSAANAITWLEKELAANGHHLVSGFEDENGQFQTFNDTGLTIDAVLAIAAAGRGADSEAKAASDDVVANLDAYVTGATPDAIAAGATAKAMLFAQVRDLDYNSLGGHDLEADLRETLSPTGRFRDKGFKDFQTNQPVDYSNAFGQVFGVLALADTNDGVPAEAVEFLVDQQCDNGGFRVTLGSAGCLDDADADLDATALALVAVQALDFDDRDDVIADAVAYLKSEQASDGSFAANANSSGIAANALRSVGNTAEARKAADYIRSVQLDAGADAGAILYDKASFDDAKANGFTPAARTVTSRATAQGLLGLGLPTYAQIGAVDPVDPNATTTTTAVSGPTTTTIAPATTTTIASATATTTRVPVTVAALARTGGGATISTAQLAFGALLIGATLVLTTRRRRIVYPFKR